MEDVIEKFLRYVKIDTESMDEQENVPSTEKQKNLAGILIQELKDMGVEDVRWDETHNYIYATIPGNVKDVPAIGFISHMDTSPAISGADVHPRLIENYDGEDIVLSKEKNIVTCKKEFPVLSKYVGKSLIVTDGTTLLGADDKAGISEIMAMAERLMTDQSIRHGKVCIGFTPDEEVGRGVDFFDVEAFQADYAYTVDGGGIGEISYENFNAAGAKLIVHGKSVHPGSAKNIMRNAVTLAMEFHSLLPANQCPEATEMYEGFYHLCAIEGTEESALVHYIIRDHDKELFAKKKKAFQDAVDYLNQKYGEQIFEAEIKDSYYNMKEMLLPHMHLVENAKQAMLEHGVTPDVQPIRGGTDGARLSFMGLPCPNLCTGGENFHGKNEFACVEDMRVIVEILLSIVKKYAE